MSELTLEAVGYRYKNAPENVLHGVDAAFLRGEVCAIIGASGSGKSTMLSLLAGLDAPTEGRILWNGQDLAEMDRDAYRREKAAVIFQAYQLFPLLTALENICYPMQLNGMDGAQAQRRAEELLARVGLAAEKGGHFPANLSGGEQQRVAIARALASGASLLLADEPTGNLDGENRQNILDILCRLAHEDGYCVIVVTHDPEVAKAADRVLRLTGGTLRQER